MKVRVVIHDVYEFDDEVHTLAELRANGGELGEEVAKATEAAFKGFSVTVTKVKE